MSVGIQIDVDTTGAERRLVRFGRAFSGRAFLELAGQRLLAWVNENFRRGGAETPWAPLSPNTIAGRRKGGGGAQPLRDTGRMAQSFVARPGPDSVTVGTEDQKAPWHHFGTRPRTIAPRGGRGVILFHTPEGIVFRRYPTRTGKAGVSHPGIPARPLLPSRELAERLAHGVLVAYVERQVSGER